MEKREITEIISFGIPCLHSILPILGLCNTDGYRMMQAERTVLAYPVLSMMSSYFDDYL